MIRIAVIFDNFGPYHIARLEALAAVVELVAVEIRARSGEYAWKPADPARQARITLLAEGESEDFLRGRLQSALDAARPQAVLVPGWSSRGALAALEWCGTGGVPAIVMSDSQVSDFSRKPAREWVKRQILRHVSGALVAGAPHVEYAMALGIPRDRILTGFDVVDNAYFQRGKAAAKADEHKLRTQLGIHRPFLLASARFVAKKNLPRLLGAYAASRTGGDGPDLVLLGDGPLRGEVEACISSLGLRSSVHLPGFVQYANLPAYYGLAVGFVHASTTEQWGLVVNEAMASSLPVIVSRACGCTRDLLHEGVNGYSFDPTDVSALTAHLLDFVAMPAERRAAMGAASARIVARWTPETFARNACRLVELALADARRPFGPVARFLNARVARRQV